jgi:hypothetical protein
LEAEAPRRVRRIDRQRRTFWPEQKKLVFCSSHLVRFIRANPLNCLAFSLGKTPIQTIPSTATPAKMAIIHKVFAIRTDC